MADLDPRGALERSEGEMPRPEFVETLRDRVEAEALAQSSGVRTAPADVTVIDPVLTLDDRTQDMSKNRRIYLLIGAIAAAIVLIAGVAIWNDDDGETQTDTLDEPDSDAPSQDSDSEPVPIDPPDDDDDEFGLTYFSVDAGGPVASNESFAWVVDRAGVNVSKVDLSTGGVTAAFAVPVGTSASAYAAGLVWFAAADGTVTAYDEETDELVDVWDIGGSAIWLEPDDESVWAGNGNGGQVVRIWPSQAEPSFFDLGVWAGVTMPMGDSAWTRTLDGSVVHLDTVNNEVVATVPTPQHSFALAVGEDSVWVPGTSDGLLHRIDATTNEIVATIDIAASVDRLIILSGLHIADGSVWVRYHFGCHAGVCDDATNAIARIDPDTNTVVATAELREGWRNDSGMSTGVDAAWTYTDDTIARVDF